MSALVIHADVVTALADVPENTYDAVLCDPPYGLSFMGKRWDYDVPDADLWRAVLRVCKPGAALIAFSGTRTYHRTVVQIEDAGWEIRDQIAWMYGSGFPKSLDVSKAMDKVAGHWRGRAGAVSSENSAMGGPNYERTPKGGAITAAAAAAAAAAGYGTALKPAYEPAVLARKPLDGTVAANVARWGTGAIAIDASRVGYVDDADQAAAAAAQRLCHDQNAGRTAYGDFTNGPASLQPYLDKQHMGRWPANVILDAEAGAALDAVAGDRKSGIAVTRNGGGGHIYTGLSGAASDGFATAPRPDSGYADDGGASRFFYCAKASREERNLGCDDIQRRTAAEMTDSKDGQARLDSPRTGAGRTGGARNHHPTVKPVDLMRYLARLIMPPTPGRMLVPFAGSGSEMIGALLAGWPDVTGIEREAEYAAIARARVALAAANPRAFEAECERAAKADARQLDMFGRTGT